MSYECLKCGNSEGGVGVHTVDLLNNLYVETQMGMEKDMVQPDKMSTSMRQTYILSVTPVAK